VQLPTFYVEAELLSELIEKAMDVLWEGRTVASPVHLSVLKMTDDMGDMPGATVRNFTVLAPGQDVPEGRQVLYKRAGAHLQEVITEQAV
jgi:hypothetical protein